MHKISFTRVALIAFFLTAVGVSIDARADSFSQRLSSLLEPAPVTEPAPVNEPAPAPAPGPVAPPASLPLAISGTPNPVAVVGTAWRFQPEAMYGSGPELRFTVNNPPPWASLDPVTGWLQGTPSQADVGGWGPILITVTDGAGSASLPEFSIEIRAGQSAAGTAELSWSAPTERVDGSPVGAIAGYRILYGTASGQYDQSAEIPNPGVTTFVVDNLAPGRWFFAVTAISADQQESAPSAEVVSDES
jgi:hypothetical protein